MNLRKTVEEIDQKYHDRRVVVVNENDQEIRIAGLVEAHRDPGIQHRAFSLQLYRAVGDKKELLLQQRAAGKPVFPYYWANTCCYNLAPGEDYLGSAARRVKEEMGIMIEQKSLSELYKFTYYVPDVEGWCERELDNVIVGTSATLSVNSFECRLNLDEVMDYKWIEWNELNQDIKNDPMKYAPWFKMIMAEPRFRSVFE